MSMVSMGPWSPCEYEMRLAEMDDAPPVAVHIQVQMLDMLDMLEAVEPGARRAHILPGRTAQPQVRLLALLEAAEPGARRALVWTLVPRWR